MSMSIRDQLSSGNCSELWHGSGTTEVETLWDSGILSLGNSDALALTALQAGHIKGHMVAYGHPHE